MTPLWATKSCPEARVLPEWLRVFSAVQLAETPACLRERDMGDDISVDSVSDMDEKGIGQEVERHHL